MYIFRCVPGMMKSYNVTPTWMDNMLVLGMEAIFEPVQYCPVTNTPPFITIPYPSFGHFISDQTNTFKDYFLNHKRRIFIFLAAGSRPTSTRNPERKRETVFYKVRHRVMKKCKYKTRKSMMEFFYRP